MCRFSSCAYIFTLPPLQSVCKPVSHFNWRWTLNIFADAFIFDYSVKMTKANRHWVRVIWRFCEIILFSLCALSTHLIKPKMLKFSCISYVAKVELYTKTKNGIILIELIWQFWKDFTLKISLFVRLSVVASKSIVEIIFRAATSHVAF